VKWQLRRILKIRKSRQIERWRKQGRLVVRPPRKRTREKEGEKEEEKERGGKGERGGLNPEHVVMGKFHLPC
jgi:hypothetical protein